MQQQNNQNTQSLINSISNLNNNLQHHQQIQQPIPSGNVDDASLRELISITQRTHNQQLEIGRQQHNDLMNKFEEFKHPEESRRIFNNNNNNNNNNPIPQQQQPQQQQQQILPDAHANDEFNYDYKSYFGDLPADYKLPSKINLKFVKLHDLLLGNYKVIKHCYNTYYRALLKEKKIETELDLMVHFCNNIHYLRDRITNWNYLNSYSIMHPLYQEYATENTKYLEIITNDISKNSELHALKLLVTTTRNDINALISKAADNYKNHCISKDSAVDNNNNIFIPDQFQNDDQFPLHSNTNNINYKAFSIQMAKFINMIKQLNNNYHSKFRNITEKDYLNYGMSMCYLLHIKYNKRGYIGLKHLEFKRLYDDRKYNNDVIRNKLLHENINSRINGLWMDINDLKIKKIESYSNINSRREAIKARVGNYDLTFNINSVGHKRLFKVYKKDITNEQRSINRQLNSNNNNNNNKNKNNKKKENDEDDSDDEDNDDDDDAMDQDNNNNNSSMPHHPKYNWASQFQSNRDNCLIEDHINFLYYDPNRGF